MNARERILGRIRAAPPGAPAPMPVLAAPPAAAAPDGLLADFCARIEAAHAEVRHTDTGGWPEALAELMRAKGLRRLLVGPGTPEATALASRADAGIELVAWAGPFADWRSDCFETVDAALTTAKSAIAATGSLVLWPDAREPRTASLIPPVHFALLDARRIHADLLAAMRAERWAEGMPTNALVVSGPSKTADIQQTLAYGAHGPRELVVLVVHPGTGGA